MARFVHHAHQLGHFVIDGVAARTEQNPNLPVREIPLQLFQNRHGGIALISDAKNQFIFRIVLPAVTGKVFVSLGIHPAKGLEVADGRGKPSIRGQPLVGVSKEPPRAEQHKQVINKRRGCEDEKKTTGSL